MHEIIAYPSHYMKTQRQQPNLDLLYYKLLDFKTRHKPVGAGSASKPKIWFLPPRVWSKQ